MAIPFSFPSPCIVALALLSSFEVLSCLRNQEGDDDGDISTPVTTSSTNMSFEQFLEQMHTNHSSSPTLGVKALEQRSEQLLTRHPSAITLVDSIAKRVQDASIGRQMATGSTNTHDHHRTLEKLALMPRNQEILVDIVMHRRRNATGKPEFRNSSLLEERMPTFTMTWELCTFVKLFLVPCLLTLIGSYLIYACLLVKQDAHDETELPLALGVYCNFQDNTLFTVTLINSLQFVAILGSTRASIDSGILVGIHKIGTSIGMVVSALAFRCYPQFLQTSKRILLLGAVLQILGGFMYGGIGLASLSVENDIDTERPSGETLTVERLEFLQALFAARFLQGMGGGFQMSWAWNMSAQLLTGSNRSTQNMRNFAAGCLGLGAGPLSTSMLKSVSKLLPCHRSISVAGMFPLTAMLPLVQLVVFYGARQPFIELQAKLPLTSELISDTLYWRCAVHTLLCIAMHMLRNLSLAGIEAGISQILQTEYRWGEISIGIGVFVPICAALPVQMLFERFKPAFHDRTWTILMLWSSVFACGVMLVPSAFVLIAASAVLFPLMTLSSGLVIGRMQTFAFPRGYVLDLGTSTLLGIVASDFFGRGQGPPLSRWRVHDGGQTGFAYLQIAICATTAVLYHIVLRVVPSVGDSRGDAQDPRQVDDSPCQGDAPIH